MQMVRLVRNGEVIKASKRSGKSITLVTLLDEVPIDAARFFFNLREPNSHFDFDLDLAVEQSNNNPVFYVQYAHARICSIIAKLASEGKIPNALLGTANSLFSGGGDELDNDNESMLSSVYGVCIEMVVVVVGEQADINFRQFFPGNTHTAIRCKIYSKLFSCRGQLLQKGITQCAG